MPRFFNSASASSVDCRSSNSPLRYMFLRGARRMRIELPDRDDGKEFGENKIESGHHGEGRSSNRKFDPRRLIMTPGRREASEAERRNNDQEPLQPHAYQNC